MIVASLAFKSCLCAADICQEKHLAFCTFGRDVHRSQRFNARMLVAKIVQCNTFFVRKTKLEQIKYASFATLETL